MPNEFEPIDDDDLAILVADNDDESTVGRLAREVVRRRVAENARAPDPQSPPMLWGLWHPEKGLWKNQTRKSVNAFDRREDAEMNASFLVPGYRPVPLVSLEAVVGMLRERLARIDQLSTDAFNGGDATLCVRLAGGSLEINAIIRDLESLGAPNA